MTTDDGADRTFTFLGGGDDSFTGGSRADDVYGGLGADNASTGAGDDVWGYPDESDVAELGDGDDLALVDTSVPPDALDGGSGMNTLSFGLCCVESPRWVIDNVAEVATVDGVPQFHWDNFTGLVAGAYVPGTVEFIGSDEAERFVAGEDLGTAPTVERVDMAGGDDEVVLSGNRKLGTIDAGDGSDEVVIEHYGDARSLSPAGSVLVDLADQFLNVDGDRLGTLTGVEHVDLSGFVRAVVRGDGGANRIRVGGKACVVRLAGGGGPDVLLVRERGGCPRYTGATPRVRAFGNAGDDLLWGRNHNDRLLGGSGDDAADGRRGTDVCEAESTVRCERTP